jgi:hypothetical protein
VVENNYWYFNCQFPGMQIVISGCSDAGASLNIPQHTRRQENAIIPVGTKLAKACAKAVKL